MTASDTSRAPCASAITSGAPESSQPRSSSSAVSGVRSDGLSSTAQPAASAPMRVHQRVGDRVVPRRDDADHRARPVVHLDLLDRQERQRRGPGLRRERLLHRLDVVRGDHDQQRHLLRGVGGRLAGLLDQQRLDLVAVLAEPDRVAGQHLGAALRRRAPPTPSAPARSPAAMRGTSAGSVHRTVPATAPVAGLRMVSRSRQSTSGVAVMAHANHCCDRSRSGVDTCQVRAAPAARHAHDRGAEQHRPDGVGEVVVGERLAEQAEHAEDDRHDAPPTCAPPRHQHDHPARRRPSCV